MKIDTIIFEREFIDKLSDEDIIEFFGGEQLAKKVRKLLEGCAFMHLLGLKLAEEVAKCSRCKNAGNRIAHYIKMEDKP